MLTRKSDFGITGIRIPPIIFGTSALGNLYTALSEEDKLSIVSECMNHVENPVVFDSAGKYGAGLALEMLGKMLKKLNVEQDGVLISNKLGWERIPLEGPEPTFEVGVWKDLKFDAKQSISYEGILKCFEQGNELLGMGYTPQLVSVHDPDEYMAQAKSENESAVIYKDILDAYKALMELKKEGKVKAVGVGAKDWKIIERLAKDIDLDWVMFANSMTIFRHPPELLSFMNDLNERGVGIINSAVFNAGFLIGGDFFDYQQIKPDTPEHKKIFKWREDFLSLCKKHDIPPAIACVHFGMTAPGVVAISLNTSNPARVKKNVESVSTQVPQTFYNEMKEQGLISRDYSYV